MLVDVSFEKLTLFVYDSKIRQILENKFEMRQNEALNYPR